MEQKPQVRVEEAETLAESLLTPNELEMIRQMSQDVDDVPAEESAPEPIKKDEIKEEVKESPIKTEVKSQGKDVLEDLLGLKRPEPTPDINAPKLTEEQNKIFELERELNNRKEVDVLKQTLEKLPPEEADLIAEEVVRLIQSDVYDTLKGMPIEKRVASLILQARGLQADAIREKILATKDAESQTRKEYEGLSTVKGKSNEIDTEAQRIRSLQEASLNKDRDAMTELMGLNDPALEALIKQSL